MVRDKTGRLVATGGIALASLAQAACMSREAAVRPPLSAAAPERSAPRAQSLLTLDTPIQDIVSAPGGKAILDRDLPGLTSRAEYPMFKTMSLQQLARMSGGKLSGTQLARVRADLGKLAGDAGLR